MSGLDASAGAPTSPADSVGDPFTPLADQIDELGAFIELVYDDPQEWMARFVDELLTLPPEERFTDATTVITEQITEEFGSAETLQAQLSGVSPDRLRRFVIRLLNQLVDETIQGIWFVRDAEPYLIVAAGYAGLLWASNGLDETDNAEAEALFSATLAYFARLYALSNDDTISDDDRAELVRDVARTLWHVERAIGGEASFVDDPETATDEQLRERVREFGAAVAYNRLDISVGRGAELAGLSRPAFEALLEEYDVAPRFGPDSVADLYGETEAPAATDRDTGTDTDTDPDEA